MAPLTGNESGLIKLCHVKGLHYKNHLFLFPKFDDHPINIAKLSVQFNSCIKGQGSSFMRYDKLGPCIK